MLTIDHFSHTYRRPGGRAVSTHVVPFAKLATGSPEAAGLYAWYYRPTISETGKSGAKFIASVLAARSLRATLSGHLRFAFSGDLTQDTAPASRVTDDDSAALQACLLVANSPLYIGISGNLRNRLLSHKKHLVKTLDSRRNQQWEAPQTDARAETPEPSSDTEEESRYFGERLAQMWDIGADVSLNGLFVRCVSTEEFCAANTEQFTSDYDRDQLLRIEWFLNSALTPPLGRK